MQQNVPQTSSVQSIELRVVDRSHYEQVLESDIFFKRFGITYKSYLEQLNSNVELERYHRDLDEILASKKLVVALRERDFVYHERGQKQFMHVLAEEFADYLGVSLEYVVTPDFADYWKTSEGDIVKDSTYTPELFNYFDLSCETIAPLDWRSDNVNMAYDEAVDHIDTLQPSASAPLFMRS